MATVGEIPALAFGTWQIPDGEPAVECVGWALEAGYRHIDTAQRYANEAGVGDGDRPERAPPATRSS